MASVFVFYATDATWWGNAEPDWWRWQETQYSPSLLIRSSDPIERLDLRALVGLNIILLPQVWDERVARLHELLMTLAEEIAVLSPAFGDDIGWWWHKRYGKLEWGERHILTEYQADEDLRAMNTAHTPAADAAYRAAAARNAERLEAHPWLKS